MSEYKIQPKSLGGLVRSLSGLFITPDNPNGISPKECTVIAHLLMYVGNKSITKADKEQISTLLNQGIQVTTNYINKFKQKKIITKDNRLHPLFFKSKITIENAYQTND